jgi:hypothetical protein
MQPPPSGYGAQGYGSPGHPPPAKKSLAPLKIGAAFLVGGVAYVTIFGLPFGVGATEVYVECRSAGAILASGLSCSITHRKGSAAHVCWNVDISCANGTRGRASGCGGVEVGAVSSVNLPFSAFNGSLDRCDAVSSSQVGGLVLTKK